MPCILTLNTQGYSPKSYSHRESDTVAFTWPAVAIDSLKLRASGSRPLDVAESLVISMFSCVECFMVAVSKLTNPTLEMLSTFYQCIIRKRIIRRELLL